MIGLIILNFSQRRFKNEKKYCKFFVYNHYCFFIHCEELSYEENAIYYNVSKDDIKEILGVYINSKIYDYTKSTGDMIWNEDTFSWGKGITNNFSFTEIDNKPIGRKKSRKIYVWSYDIGIICTIEKIKKESVSSYYLYGFYHIGQTEESITIKIVFKDDSMILIEYNSSHIKEKILLTKVAGIFIPYRPLPGKYIVGRNPYSEQSRAYNSWEELDQGEKEYVRKKMKQKKSSKSMKTNVYIYSQPNYLTFRTAIGAVLVQQAYRRSFEPSVVAILVLYFVQ